MTNNSENQGTPMKHSREYVSLKEYFESKFENLENTIKLKYCNIEKATEAANDSMESYFEEKFKSLDNSVNLKYSNIEKSTSLAATSIDRRLESMNEFRDSLKDQATKFMTKDEFQILHQRVEEDVRILRESKATLEGRASMTSVYISYVIGVIGLVVAVLALFLH